jgi:hypothetical protein
MERSKVPLTKWVMAYHLMASSRGVSRRISYIARRLQHPWFMAHRIREAMTEPNPAPLGGEGKVVEVDEAYHGRKEIPLPPSPNRHGRSYLKQGKRNEKRTVIALVERGGEARAIHLRGRVTAENIREFVVIVASRKSRLHTDQSRL